MNSDREHVVIFSIEAPLSSELLAQMQQLGWPLIEVKGCGDALRHIALMQPSAIVVPTLKDDHVELAALLIRELRQRRPQLPVIALADEHDDDIERCVRAAGASAYVAGLNDGAASLIAAAGNGRAQTPVEVSLHSGCSPPSRARAPTRSRGRPRRSRAE